jgi:translation initiation factor 4G
VFGGRPALAKLFVCGDPDSPRVSIFCHYQVEEQKVYLKNLAARKRMLGNIQFIGHLYKKKILTERIMHECILKLLQGQGTPAPEDVECLCKLMSTIGREIDIPRSKQHMEVYFQRIKVFSQAKGLESRLRFALQDLIELRENSWTERRKVRGVSAFICSALIAIVWERLRTSSLALTYTRVYRIRIN